MIIMNKPMKELVLEDDGNALYELFRTANESGPQSRTLTEVLCIKSKTLYLRSE